MFCSVFVYRGARCEFPFYYNDEEYHWCTQADSKKWWCSVTKYMKRDGKWGYCNIARQG